MRNSLRIPFLSRENGAGLTSIPMGASVAWSPQNNLSPEFLAIAGGLLLAVALLLVLLQRRKRKQDEVPLSPMEDAAFIDELLTQCTDKRLRLSITCSRNKISHSQAAGILLAAEDPPPAKLPALQGAPLTIVLSDAPRPDEWHEAPVDIYFHFTVDGEKTFYHFSTFVQSLEQKGNAWHMTVARPSVLTNNQRREFVRVVPPTDCLEAITAWPLSAQPLLTLPTEAHALGRPPFAYRPPRVILMEMLDISAGGMRLRLPVAQVRAKQVRCAPGVRFVVLLMIDALRPDGSRQMLWLSTTVRRALLTEDKTHVELGLQFTHWAPTTALTDPLHWEPVEADGEVPFLLRWVSRVNTLLARMQ